MTIEEALAAGVPKSVIIEAWQEADEMCGTNMTADLIRQYFVTQSGTSVDSDQRDPETE
jgi:hypothetical protein